MVTMSRMVDGDQDGQHGKRQKKKNAKTPPYFTIPIHRIMIFIIKNGLARISTFQYVLVKPRIRIRMIIRTTRQ